MKEINKGRTFCLGDIHGSYKALVQVLERSGFNNEEDTLISLGDIADGWHEVPECVELLLGIRNLIAIRGNHDVWLRDWLKSGYKNPLWLPQGGQASYDAYINRAINNKESHAKFFEDQVDYYIDKNNNLFVHAGWDIGWKYKFIEAGLYPVNGGNPDDNISKECHWNRELFYQALNAKRGGVPHLNLALALSEYFNIFVGHTSLPEPYEVFNYKNFYNLDTGCGWDGKLTIMDVESKQFWQSDPNSELYPGVKGRS